jgi:hypothetical protein
MLHTSNEILITYVCIYQCYQISPLQITAMNLPIWIHLCAWILVSTLFFHNTDSDVFVCGKMEFKICRVTWVDYPFLCSKPHSVQTNNSHSKMLTNLVILMGQVHYWQMREWEHHLISLIFVLHLFFYGSRVLLLDLAAYSSSMFIDSR